MKTDIQIAQEATMLPIKKCRIWSSDRYYLVHLYCSYFYNL